MSRQLSRPVYAILNPVIGMIIYLDVLLLSNLWADYALLCATAAVTHVPLKRLRGLCAALLGACGSLMILLPPMPPPVCLLLRCILTLAVCAAAFGIRSVRALLRQSAFLTAVSLFFCGAVYLLSHVWEPVGCYTQNTAVYTDVSLTVLLAGTALAAALTTLRTRYRAKANRRNYRILLNIQGRQFSLPALADTGNTLRDAFTGKPVAVCPSYALEAWLNHFPDSVSAAASCKSFRMQPVQTVTGRRLLPLFQPDSAAICRADIASGTYPVDLLIAISDQSGTEIPVLVPASVIP